MALVYHSGELSAPPPPAALVEWIGRKKGTEKNDVLGEEEAAK